jgi:hypothetical protein
VNKWDLVARDKRAAHAAWAQAMDELAFLERPYVIKTSVVGAGSEVGQGQARGLDELLEACLKTARALGRRIPTADLNAELASAVAEHSPPMFGPRPVKLLFATQAESDPPLIVVAANHGRCLSPAIRALPPAPVPDALGPARRAGAAGRTRARQGQPRARQDGLTWPRAPEGRRCGRRGASGRQQGQAAAGGDSPRVCRRESLARVRTASATPRGPLS